jgi:hypothetical protein
MSVVFEILISLLHVFIFIHQHKKGRTAFVPYFFILVQSVSCPGIKNKNFTFFQIFYVSVVLWDTTTGRQLPPLSSVLYGIISRRRSVLAAQLLLREKSGA